MSSVIHAFHAIVGNLLDVNFGREHNTSSRIDRLSTTNAKMRINVPHTPLPPVLLFVPRNRIMISIFFVRHRIITGKWMYQSSPSNDEKSVTHNK